MSTKSINFKIDEKLKSEADKVLEEIGLNMTSALTLFLEELVNKREIPFKLEANDPFYSLENQLVIEKRIREHNNGKHSEHELIDTDNEYVD